MYQELSSQGASLLQEEGIILRKSLINYFDQLLNTVPYDIKLAVLRINFLARCRDTSGVFLFSRPLYPLFACRCFQSAHLSTAHKTQAAHMAHRAIQHYYISLFSAEQTSDLIQTTPTHHYSGDRPPRHNQR